MNIQRAMPMLLIMALSAAPNLNAQALGQFTTASPAADGEGSVFMLAGNDAFRTGVSARFNISPIADFGLQIGLDRACKESFFGGGIDFKLVLLENTEKLPLNLALDASFGGLDSNKLRRFLFDFGILASGVIKPPSVREIDPYLSFIVRVEQRGDTSSSNACLCAHNDKTETDTFVRAGVRVSTSEETQILLEADLNSRALFGAAFNIVF